MGQCPLFAKCPVCGGHNRIFCYGVIHGGEGGVIRRYFRCGRCGRRLACEYRGERAWRIISTKKTT